MGASDDIGRNDVVRLLHAFYASVRRDPELAPWYNSEIPDWDVYLEQMSDFWCDVVEQGPDVTPPCPPGIMFGFNRATLSRWRTLFAAAANETLPPPQAERMRALAQQVSEQVQL